MTRIGVLSDSHGDHDALEVLLQQMGHLDAVCFLGDVAMDSDWLQAHFSLMPNPPVFWAVRGNNDLACTLPDKLMVLLGGRRIFMTHGHLYHVRRGPDELALAASRMGAEIALYGHTHEPFCGYERGVFVLNPGAAGNRWGQRARGSVLLLEEKSIRTQDVIYGAEAFL